MNNDTPTNTSVRRSSRLSNVDLTATNSDNTHGAVGGARKVAVLIDSFASTDLHPTGSPVQDVVVTVTVTSSGL